MCKISVIIPYYNSEKTILRALNSVISQTYSDYEIILINDGSTDNSQSIVSSFIESNREVKIINIYQNNKGPSAARNLGISLAKGEYIAFLDSDDEWEMNKLLVQINEINIYGCDMIGCNYSYYVNNKFKQFNYVKSGIKKVSFKETLLKHYFNTSSVIIKKDVLNSIGGFPENQRYMEDALLYTMISRKYRAFVSNKILVKCYKYPYGDSGLSSRLDEMEWNEIKNFKRLKKENYLYNEKIGCAFYLFIICFSILKYLRRKFIVLFRKYYARQT